MSAPQSALPAAVTGPDADPARRAVFEALGTARTMRYLRADPVPAGHVEALVWAATRASSADNFQPWEFIAVSDRERITALAAVVAPFRDMVADLPPPAGASEARTIRGAHYLFDHLAQVPLLLFICGRGDVRIGLQPDRYIWSAVAGAAQNVLVAARALGLGAAYTMFHLGNEEAVRQLLGLPAEVRPGVLMAVGWPERQFGPLARKPVSEVLHYEHW